MVYYDYISNNDDDYISNNYSIIYLIMMIHDKQQALLAIISDSY